MMTTPKGSFFSKMALRAWLRVPFMALAVAIGCTSGSSGDDTADDETGGSGGIDQSGGAASGGTPNGGTGGTGGWNQELPGAHCTPGVKREALFLYPDPIQNCGFTGSGELEGVDAYYRTIKLEESIGPGDTFAFSVEDNSAEGIMELWGTTEECGPALEKLATSQGGLGIFCMEVSPQDGTYSHLVWVRYSGGEHGDATFCLSGSCGAR